MGGTQPPRENKEINDERASCSNRPISDCCVGIGFILVCTAVFNGFAHVCFYVDQLRLPYASIVPFVVRGRVRFRQINRDQSVISAFNVAFNVVFKRERADGDSLIVA